VLKIILWITVLVAAAAALLYLLARLRPDLTADFQAQLKAELASDTSHPRPVLTAASIASLPTPVQRYIRLTGALGKPRAASLRLTFEAEMFQKPGQAGMRGVIKQYDRFDPPKRLFHMKTRMSGLPVTVLHDYDGHEAQMTVRLASLFNVVNAKGNELSRTETVTLLNDLCLFAPSWLTDPRLVWTPKDDTSALVKFTNGPHIVKATLLFNAAGELVNFISDDRAAMQSDGKLKITRWSTPMRNYQDVGGLKVASEGDAIWHYPEGDFVYGHFKLLELISE
jgi:hypothetical protein